MDETNAINWQGVKESLGYRSPIREEPIITGESLRQVRKESSESKVGCMISGGIDSTFVLLGLSNEEREIEAFTLVWPEVQSNEHVRAKKVIDILKEEYEVTINHHIIKCKARKYITYYEKAGECGPHARPAYLPVLECASEKGLKVLFSGEGGDELYAGYVNKYRRMNRAKSLSFFRPLASFGTFLPGNFGNYCRILSKARNWESYEAARTWVKEIYLPESFTPYRLKDWISSTINLDYRVRLKHYLDTISRMAESFDMEVIFPLLKRDFNPEAWRDYWRGGDHGKKPLITELEQADNRLAEIATSRSVGFCPPDVSDLWNQGLGSLVIDEIKDSPLRKMVGSDINQVIDNEGENGEWRDLSALTEMYTLTKYLRKRGCI